VANALRRRSVGHGDFVAVLTRNRLEHVLLYYATARLGAILAPINFWFRDDEIRWTLEQVHPRVFVLAAEWDELLGARDALDAAHVVVLDTEDTDAPETESWSSLLADPDASAPGGEVGERDVHILFWTSGTTGAAKGVLKTQRGHVLNAMQYALALGLNEDDRGLCAFPLFNVGGYESTFAKYVHLGGSVVMLPKFDAGEVLAAIERDRITTMLANPTTSGCCLITRRRAPRTSRCCGWWRSAGWSRPSSCCATSPRGSGSGWTGCFTSTARPRGHR
jgi:fatty-acyl-CoA synthase